MSGLNPKHRERLLELLADQRLGQLAVEDAGELESLRDNATVGADLDNALGELLVAFDDADDAAGMPDNVRQHLAARGRRLVGEAPSSIPMPRPSALTGTSWLLRAAAALLLVGTIAISAIMISGRQQQLRESKDQIAQLREQIEDNTSLLSAARTRVADLQLRLDDTNRVAGQQERALAAAAAEAVEQATLLAEATSQLEAARVVVAQYEQPTDPAELAANRRRLLDVPDTVRIAWQPFDLPDAPAEQRQVAGDVVWNDELQQGYLRFVGLTPNDPNIEQYQVWIIDERGMEQKVSGGVFNATAQGEVIVPIEPGIDIRRVALFAVTIEEPGGTWVPDLSRRVVVAPREG